jgi:hypothetical protein
MPRKACSPASIGLTLSFEPDHYYYIQQHLPAIGGENGKENEKVTGK